MPEFRKDPLVSRWVVFAPERSRRPIQMKPAETPLEDLQAFSSGNEHLTPPEVFALRPAHSAPNTPGWRVRVVPNRFPAFRIEGALDPEAVGFYDRMNGLGAHEVVIETPEPESALEDLSVDAVAEIFQAHQSRMLDLTHDHRLRYFISFKNVGFMAGASIRHAHSQLVALPIVPRNEQEKLDGARRYYAEKQRNLFADILRNETRTGTRVVYENAGFLVYCPFASRFPFEMGVLPKRQSPDFTSIDPHERLLLADAVRQALGRLNKGLGAPAYNLILHTAPVCRHNHEGGTLAEDYRWHIEILPRLTGIAGFELGTGFFINTTLPEEAAQFLRSIAWT
jgi:UDPglucose--hexose-1-phosphate uridylyltransferase